MSASEKDLNNIGPSHAGSNVAGNASGSGGPIGNHDASSSYFGHLHYPHQANNSGAASSKPPSQSQKPASSQKSAVNSPPTSTQKPKQTPRPSTNQPTTIKPSATTNPPAQPPKNAPAPTPPGSAAVMAAVMAQAQAAAGQAVAAQQANKQQHQQSQSQQPQPQPQQSQQLQQPPAQPPAAQHPPPIPAHHPPQAYPYPYPYYLPPGQPGAPPYLYPGAPGAPAFLPAGTPGQGGAPPPGYPYMYPMYPAPIPVPQATPAPVVKEKKSQRTYQACQKCRQWKAKCNGLKPCNHCQKRGVPCEYAERRNMTNPNETNNGEQGGSQEESSQPQVDVKPGGATADAVDPSALNNTQPQTSPVASNPPPPPPASHAPVQVQAPAPPPPPAPAQASPPTAGSPPHPAQVAQPPPMAIYPPPPPGYAYPPQLYPGMPFPAPGPDPNAPYGHFVGMQYAQPYGPYMWAAPPPPPGHELAPAAHAGEQEEGERDADGKLKIKRTFQACQKCRQRKAKCNGVRPSCQNCTSRGYVCEYAKERSKPRGTNGEEGEETLDTQGTEAPTTMDPSQAMVSTAAPPVNPNQQAAPGAPPVPTAAPPNIFPPPPFAYDPNAYNPHVDPHHHGGQPMYPFPPYGYAHPPGFGSIAGPPLVHIGEEGSVPPYHAAPPAVIPGPPPSNSPTSGSSKRPRTVRPPGAPGTGKARIFQACERCRERKAKCDGVRPICTHCATRDLNCEWADKRRMRGPAKGITPRRNRPEPDYGTEESTNVNMGMPPIPLGLNTAGLQQIEPHTSTNSSMRKRKRRPSHSSGSPSPSESSSSSESSPSESDDDDADRNSSMGMGTGAVSTGWA